MRKLLLILILLAFISGIHAQYKPVLFGLRAAASINWIKPDTEGYSSDGAEMGFTWGFIGQFFLMENYAILTGFNINFNGGKLAYPYLTDIAGDSTVLGTLNRNYNLKYIQIPLCLKMQADISEKVRIFGKIGLGTAFLLNAKAKDVFIYDSGEIPETTNDIENEISLMRESLILGGGVEFILKGSTALVVDLTYDNGFNNIFTFDNPATPTEMPKAVLNCVEVGAGIIF
jgi:hypothetical protein